MPKGQNRLRNVRHAPDLGAAAPIGIVVAQIRTQGRRPAQHKIGRGQRIRKPAVDDRAHVTKRGVFERMVGQHLPVHFRGDERSPVGAKIILVGAADEFAPVVALLVENVKKTAGSSRSAR